LISCTAPQERAILVGFKIAKRTGHHSPDSLEELKSLAQSAGAQVAATLMQDWKLVDPAFFIGSGKVAELHELLLHTRANLVIFDDDLSPAQQRNLEDALEVTVLDRTGLILDIFAQRARSREGKLQVELAQLTYLMPRLRGKGVFLSRLGGGIGTRGPGETRLEMDRRKIRARMTRVKKDLEQVKKVRATQRVARSQRNQQLAALIGYTNAGKSTILNALTQAHVPAENRLFSTLDPTIRRLGSRGTILVSDTVGFIRKLPHQLIAAFKATLEEINQASLLLHVVDVSSPHIEEQVASVNSILQELGIDAKDTLYVLNKIDRVPAQGTIRLWQRRLEPVVAISAVTGEGLDNLYAWLEQWRTKKMLKVHLRLPLSEGRAIDKIFKSGRVMYREYSGQDILLEAELDHTVVHNLQRFIIPAFRKKAVAKEC
jgi:GTP-binding protein HflX